MRRAVIGAVLSMGAIAVGAAPANGAATRAEYVAQVDPICQAFRGPASAADSAYIKNYKRWFRVARKGTVKAFVRQTNRTAGSLLRFTQIHMSVTDQIATVPPAAADTGTVNTWLNYRRKSDAFSTSAASALRQLKFKRFFEQNDHADAAEAAGRVTIAPFGFQVCAVPGVYL
jgi:hypothetical protein